MRGTVEMLGRLPFIDLYSDGTVIKAVKRGRKRTVPAIEGNLNLQQGIVDPPAIKKVKIENKILSKGGRSILKIAIEENNDSGIGNKKPDITEKKTKIVKDKMPTKKIKLEYVVGSSIMDMTVEADEACEHSLATILDPLDADLNDLKDVITSEDEVGGWKEASKGQVSPHFKKKPFVGI
jgi:hypothetical protein